jgi:hypothetical protein
MSSYAVATSETRPKSTGQWADLRLAPWVLAILVVALAFGGLTGLLSLREVAVIAFAIQLVTAYQLTRVHERTLSIASMFAALWIIYFPLRLLVITFGEPSPFYFPSVRAASPEQLISVWEVTTAAFLLFLIGQLFAYKSVHIKGSVDNLHLTHRQLFVVGVGAVGVTATLTFLHLSSGILGNVGQLVLLAIAGASYLEGKAERRSYASLLLVVVAFAFGYLNGFKELMLLPVAAWVIGRAGAGDRFRLRYVVVVAVATAIAFAIIQGERDAARTGQLVPSPISALQLGLTSYDLAYGTPSDYHGLGIAANAATGVLYRLKGADFYITIADKVPSLVPYQDGRSLWQPALSVLPGAKQFLDLEPQYKQLSLGRYIDQVLISENPTQDLSSQSTTVPGDLYLNFGVPGVMVGMLILGVLYGIFDRRFVIKGPLSAGILAFAGLPLIQLDANVAYILVTCGLRLGICVVLLSWFVLSRRGQSLNHGK